MKHCLRSLEPFDHQVVPSLEFVWLSSPSLRFGSLVSLRTRTILFGQGRFKKTCIHCLRQPSGSSTRSDIGKPLAYDGGSCKISSSVAVSIAAMLGRLFARCSILKEVYKSKRVVAWSQLRGSVGSRDFHIRSKGQFKRTKQAFRKYTSIHSLSVC